MQKKWLIIALGLVALATLTGFLVYKAVASPSQKQEVAQEEKPQDQVVPLDEAVSVELTKSKLKDNTIVLSVNGLGSKYTSVAYELSYDSGGIVQGVTSKPLDVSGKDSFVRDDIYLGTCSRNVCRPHPGVKKISVVLEFTTVEGKKSQFTKDYDLSSYQDDRLH
ncbi:hypothetical protein HY409_01145 [Candidatus Gottesmanbacteria bacterium]|nr:hypothetical protein [Candidatus Gottesmanbacteria bacterium]